MEDAKLIVVESCGSRPQAELIRGALEEAGILAMIQGDTAGGMREHLAWSGAGFQILVRDEDSTAARDLLAPPPEGDLDADCQPGADDPAPSWRSFT